MADKASKGSQDLSDQLVEIIKSGKLNQNLVDLSDAIDAQIETWIGEQKKEAKKTTAKKTASKSADKKVPSAPSRTVAHKVGTTYVVSEKAPKMAGCRVKFVEYKDDDPNSKARVEVLDGEYEGRRVLIPRNAVTAIKKQRKVN